VQRRREDIPEDYGVNSEDPYFKEMAFDAVKYRVTSLYVANAEAKF
jgi:hypothetical protein